MRTRRPRLPGWRAAAHLAIIVAGLVAVVGSGGGIGIGYPDIDWGGQTPPPIYVVIAPTRPTVQVGSIVQFEATVTNAAAPIGYQWQRNGVEIRGATGPTFVVGGAQIADDGALFQVKVSAANGIAVAGALLQVSPYPPAVIEDMDFPVAGWSVIAEPDPSQNGPTHAEAQGTDGNPGAFRSIDNQLTSGPSGLLLRHYATGAMYDPGSQGAIYALYLTMDCRRTFSTPGTVGDGEPYARVVFDQGGRTFEPRDWDQYCRYAWGTRRMSSLAEDGFVIFSGPPCGAGERCPDFSVTGAPLRFGFSTRARLWPGSPPGTVTLGVDNWSVTIWKR